VQWTIPNLAWTRIQGRCVTPKPKPSLMWSKINQTLWQKAMRQVEAVMDCCGVEVAQA